jgi:hypothetical protein
MPPPPRSRPRWHVDGNRRAGDVIVVGALGYVIVKSPADPVIDIGNHGWDPGEEEMHGIFVAAGPQVKHAGTIPAFENVSVYSFLAALLQLEHVPPSDGDASVLHAMLRVSPSD